MSNFAYLQECWPELAREGRLAEGYLFTDPNASLFKARLIAEKLLDLYLTAYKLEFHEGQTQWEKIELLKANPRVKPGLVNAFDFVRRYGNQAAHHAYNDKKTARDSLIYVSKLAYFLYIKVTGKKDTPYTFTLPAKQPPAKILQHRYTEEQYQEEIARLKAAHEAELARLKEQLVMRQVPEEAAEVQLASLTNELELTEAETRKRLIDTQLRDAGWDVENPEQVLCEYAVTDFPSASGKGYVDYLLLAKAGKPIALVEAKKTAENPAIGRTQAQLYADSLEKMHGVRPVIFYTNGFEIYIWDDRASNPRQIWGFYTMDELEFMMLQREQKKPLGLIAIDPEIAGREYQIEGIKRVYEKFTAGHRRALLVMATGAGKTRTVIALVKGMLEAGWVKRVLFLADRDELVKQAMNGASSFKTFLPETTRVRVNAQTAGNREATLYFATYQAMMKQFRKFGVGFFDLVILDESHRSIYKYYREIIDYFDAYLIGLTATPVNHINRNTFNLFDCLAGDATFYYSYDQAREHVPPYLLGYRVWEADTGFLRKGIKWADLTPEQKEALEEDGYAEEQIDFEKNEIEEFVTNRPTNAFILESLMEKGIRVQGVTGKTIIFARNINHAQLLLEIFEELYPQYNGTLATIIHSKIPYSQTVLERFKNNDRPRIAISVDMLDTGIDIPEVVNLVFAKPVYSKVKFLQMIGRGTRTCANLLGPGEDKDHFRIIDTWSNFAFFDLHPEGVKEQTGKTPLQRRFEYRVQMLELLHNQKDAQHTAEMVRCVREDIDNLPTGSIQIRRQWRILERLKADDAWVVITEALLSELRTQVAPLMQWIDVGDEHDALWFDNQIYKLQVYKLTADQKVVSQVQYLTGEMNRLRLNLNQFNGHRDYVQNLQKEEPWYLLNYDELEHCRVRLRDLMRYRGEMLQRGLTALNVMDTGQRVEERAIPQAGVKVDMAAYVLRVVETLEKELNMHLVMYKIRKGEALTELEMQALYAIFDSGRLAVSIQEIAEVVHVKQDDLEGILRKFVGVDEEELNRRFHEFIQSHPGITPRQINILEMIKRDIVKNKGISFAALYEEPYSTMSSEGIDGLFEDWLVNELFALIRPYKVEMEEDYA